MIQVNMISKSFANRIVIDNLSFVIDKPITYGLLGQNGAGKTTTIKMICGLSTPTKGAVFYNEDLVKSRDLGYMPEGIGLYMDMKVIDHIRYFATLHGIQYESIVNEITQLIDRLGIKTYLNYKIVQLSKGNKQKVQFICSVLHQPKVLILDEPFDGLDPLSVQAVEYEIKKLNQNGTAVIISTHRMEQVESLCDHIFIIDKGKMIVNDSVENIREQYRSDHYKIEVDKELSLTLEKELNVKRIGMKYYEFEGLNIHEINKCISKLDTEKINLIQLIQIRPSIKDIYNMVITVK